MPSEDDLKRIQKEIDASAPQPAPIDREALGLRERHDPIEKTQDDRVLTMFREISNRLERVERKIDELQTAVQELSGSR